LIKLVLLNSELRSLEANDERKIIKKQEDEVL